MGPNFTSVNISKILTKLTRFYTAISVPNMLKKIIKALSFLIFGMSLLLILLAIATYFWLVALNPGKEIQQGNIEKILAMESPVYYNDGQTKIGVFFESAHRQYINYDEIPKSFINSIIAAEDSTFFKHHGVDIQGILRALIANVQAGRVVQGGSTITQQTAKNLFKREGRSIKAKLKELVYALRLEYHYSKEKIMEFYSNQFYVSGNGHGLGVAARYFFDKSVDDLNMLECAFIAGSVKRPNYYNPFIKKTDIDIELAKIRAKERAGYVLRQMYKLNMITADEYQENFDKEISFKKGKMFYSLNTIMDTVKEALNSPQLENALSMQGIENVSTSGIKIITSVDKDLQEQSLIPFRKELSRLDTRLRGYNREEVQNSYDELTFEKGQEIKPETFSFGTVTSITSKDNEPEIHVLLEGRQELEGKIDKKGLMPLLGSLVKWHRNRWSEAKDKDLPLILNQIEKDDRIFVSIRNIDPITGELQLTLEKYPEIQGAAMVLREGKIQAMVGGMENHFYNRAIAAKRPMGSAIKPLVYAAALQLGWNTIDPLNNKRNVFVYQNEAYFPRPDHISPHEKVSMNWAGVYSENLATIWLLYHLCDKLPPAQFSEFVEKLDLSRRDKESYVQYRQRVRDKYGIVVNQDTLYKTAFRKAIYDLGPDLVFDGKVDEYEFLKSLQYGTNFEKYLEEVEELLTPEVEEDPEKMKKTLKEMKIREDILRYNFLGVKKLREEIKTLQGKQVFSPAEFSFFMADEYSGQLYFEPDTGNYIYASSVPEDANWYYVSQPQLKKILRPSLLSFGRKVSPESFWDSILIEGVLTQSTIDILSVNVRREYDQLASLPSYSPEVLHSIQDFRVMVGLQYLTRLCKVLGVKSEIEPVLSFPLGSNVISLLETARIYEGLTTGKVNLNIDDENIDELAIIDRIENSEGEVLYRADSTSREIFSSRATLAISDILKKVIKFGTGRYAYNNARLHSRDPEKEDQLRNANLRLPLLGKTGTANRFTNSAFAGFVPDLIPETNRMSLKNGYTIASYVGFDDNTPMVQGNTRISGSGGALPIWTKIANAIMLEKNYASDLDLIDLSFTRIKELPIHYGKLGQTDIRVNKGNGLFEAYPSQHQKPRTGIDVLTFGEILPNGDFEPSRHFEPYRYVME